MRENGICTQTKDMVEDTKFGLMEVFMKGIGNKTKLMVGVD
jgi:hypothetical protein